MGKGARIRKLKDEQAKLLMAAKQMAPKVAPKHASMILAIIRAFELQHQTVVMDAPILAGYISQAHQGALERGFLAYHNDLMQAIDIYFEKLQDGNSDEYGHIDFVKMKKGLLDFLNSPGKDSGKNKEPGDGHRETRPEKVHPLEQVKDKDPRNASDEIGGGIPRIRDLHLESPNIGSSDPEGKEENS